MTADSKRLIDNNSVVGEEATKKQKTESSSEIGIAGSFSENLLTDEQAKGALKVSIETSGPYKHGVIKPLINDELLRKVRTEILNELHFTRKETDIYKVNQTGDLANLSGLDEEELSKLASLAKLREALYSKEFREYLSYVAQSGPLSGVKQDMSINLYDKGCHLLNHDDVIGSRRISYILYLTDPDKAWKAKWGGALRLYPTVVPNIPEADWSVSLPPAWNQLSFFTVQPGLSFHDVEEVSFDKPRLSISGWFHIPQKGEEGFVEGEQEETEARSSLRQLQSRELLDYDFPKRDFMSYDLENTSAGSDFTDEDRKYLSKFLNPKHLTNEAIAELSENFGDNSMLSIEGFLNPEYSEIAKGLIDGEDLSPNMPKHSSEVTEPWKLARPPHKQRYLYLDGPDSEHSVDKLPKTEKLLVELGQLFHHVSFRKWLYCISTFTPTEGSCIARRFRPGYDFTLATSHDSEEQVLEATLSLTPSEGWGDGELGGYDLCMAVDEEDEDDPAVYKGGSKEKDEDSVLFTNQPSWNVFHLIVRDKGLLRFVKYVSKSAPGSRWDLTAEWKVAPEDEDEE
ncbi:Tpa1p [Sugiyamaella lignohabitans]|uniref:uS12 prolyl 3,4-dihydroxylase n=1 Tax=Sugiyamaella lignohabitans TaxID=796027 RepID=A0A167FN43_9ASCO|nr:Tpa1p [Sugiyamaella lignohabitans]ANB15501.1 Tpa1p [Sugiyamaella lignohabitans]